ncbi:kinetochore Sim4 complex subunit FTA2-domain-containing protein [Xylariomycetidae sp. FL2044]|nr:kinetochore Sim4 complex subunit FTA2-domain-containing protein [Xylariomycetidae sp. FL2044]
MTPAAFKGPAASPPLPDLPLCKGPKMHPFNNGRPTDIEFLSQLAQTDRSYVWKVRILGNIYALKMFKFFHSSRFGIHLSIAAKEKGYTYEDVHNQSEHFNAECRAFGRLKEFGREDLAVKCHGYLLLTNAQEDWLTREGASEWCDHYDREEGEQIRCLVKDLLEDEVDFTMAMIPRMIRTMHELHKYGIVHRDVKENNYIGGVLLEFDNSITFPHMVFDFDIAGYEGCAETIEFYEAPVHDLLCIDSFVDEWNETHSQKVWHRSQRSGHYLGKLRNPRLTADGFIPPTVIWEPVEFPLREARLKRKRDRLLQHAEEHEPDASTRPLKRGRKAAVESVPDSRADDPASLPAVVPDDREKAPKRKPRRTRPSSKRNAKEAVALVTDGETEPRSPPETTEKRRSLRPRRKKNKVD